MQNNMTEYYKSVHFAVFAIFLLDFGTVLTVVFFYHFIIHHSLLAKGYDPFYSSTSRTDRSPWLAKMIIHKHILLF
jgi:hypothetical protein